MEQVAEALLRGRRTVQPLDPPTRLWIHGWHEEEEVHAGGRRGRGRGRGSDGGGGSSGGRDREKERRRRMNAEEEEEEEEGGGGGDERADEKGRKG